MKNNSRKKIVLFCKQHYLLCSYKGLVKIWKKCNISNSRKKWQVKRLQIIFCWSIEWIKNLWKATKLNIQNRVRWAKFKFRCQNKILVSDLVAVSKINLAKFLCKKDGVSIFQHIKCAPVLLKETKQKI